MDDYKIGKARAYFRARAAEIELLILTNKKKTDYEICMKFSKRVTILSKEPTYIHNYSAMVPV